MAKMYALCNTPLRVVMEEPAISKIREFSTLSSAAGTEITGILAGTEQLGKLVVKDIYPIQNIGGVTLRELEELTDRKGLVILGQCRIHSDGILEPSPTDMIPYESYFPNRKTGTTLVIIAGLDSSFEIYGFSKELLSSLADADVFWSYSTGLVKIDMAEHRLSRVC